MKFATLIVTAALAQGSLADKQAYRMVGVDIVGKDITSLQMSSPLECFTYCYSAPQMRSAGCSGATWTPYQGGWCWPKRTGAKATSTSLNANAETYLVLEDASSSFIWSETKDGDIVGNDLTNQRGYSMGDCMTACNKNRNCYAVTWSGYNGGTCWLKRRASSYVPSAGAKSAYLARRVS